MAQLRTSQVLGPLKQHERYADWYEGRQLLACPFFEGEPLPVTLTGVPAEAGAAAAWISRADPALGRWLEMGKEARHGATPLVLANYQEMLDATDIEPLDLPAPEDIWRYVHPTGVTVSRDGDRPGEFETGDFFVQVACECDWEEEHGLLLVFREGRMLTRVSLQDGHLTDSHAYARPEEQDPLMMSYYAAFGRPEFS